MKLFKVFILSSVVLSFAFSQIKLPKSTGFINDFEHIFLQEEIDALDSLVLDFEKESTIEISVVTLDSNYTNKLEFDNYSLDLARYWKIGKKDKSNGILIAISKSLRKMRIQNGYGIEEKLTDSQTKLIIDSVFIPEFKKGNFYKGTNEGILALMNKVK